LGKSDNLLDHFRDFQMAWYRSTGQELELIYLPEKSWMRLYGEMVRLMAPWQITPGGLKVESEGSFTLHPTVVKMYPPDLWNLRSRIQRLCDEKQP